MIYLVTKNTELFNNDAYEVIDVKKSLDILKECTLLMYDSETSGLDPHIDKLLCFQFGSKTKGFQMVIDASTVSPVVYKDIFETRLLIGHNLKFDLQFLYKYGVIPRKCYDTMIVEQLLFLGYPSGVKSYSLQSVAYERLGIHIDKTVRGKIIWQGLNTETILYSAKDVEHLEDIMNFQYKDLISKDCVKGAQVENRFTPAIAYLEWCGIKLDKHKWKAKMDEDQKKLKLRREALDDFIIKYCDLFKTIRESYNIYYVGSFYTPYNDSEYLEHQRFEKAILSIGGELVQETPPQSNMGYYSYVYKLPKAITKQSVFDIKKHIKVNTQGDLFNGYNTKPYVDINWDSPQQVIKICKSLGFDTTVKDKKTGDDKDSVLEKALKVQKGINDEFLKLYFDYKESSKVCSTYGQKHLDSINPVTGRLHTVFRAIGASSGRMSCGSNDSNNSVSIAKRLPRSSCIYPNLQQLPADEPTRSSFVAEEGNLFVSCDYSALESRLGADIYQEPAMLKEFLDGTGDMHSLCAWMVFRKECEALGCKGPEDVKEKASKWRKAVKPIEFSQQFGGSAFAVQGSMGCSLEEAEEFVKAYGEGFKGITAFKAKGSKFVRENGYVLMCKHTGHKMYWWDHDVWLDRQKSFTQEFWQEYREKHKGTGDDVARMVKEHFQAASKWDRMALNSVTQGTGAIIIKDATTQLFNWIVDNGYFNKIKLCALVHDEVDAEFPEELKDTFPELLEKIMEDAAAKYCKSIPIPAEASVGKYWIH